ncbi:putative threonine efflux protein [Desulfocapsa sulfexigens DSM 10523]|uniref:Putative threonine efflux protein n=1 Tax=Desulfocapsa sulfexigens (strain DSM 10523 / SB164P1) TaxID=1167006 RepID=M1PQR3_DESSD|nr:LysE family translocator [Desulfocapsa sulfexigens]AGF78741.1 putative threonine efflux protein [Desulfocapsa sulfexigens DSM 10523]
MTTLTLITFGAAMFLLAASPGPGVFATVARALSNGFAHAAILVLGIVTGDLIFLLLAVYGLSAMAEILGSFFVFVKYGGGLYLIWLGIKIWRSAPEPVSIEGIKELSWKKNFGSGLIITLANPKVILFYLGFLPTFVDLASLSHLDILAISIVVTTVLGSVLLCYAWTAARAGQLFKSAKALKMTNRCAGGVMITAGCAILLKD